MAFKRVEVPPRSVGVDSEKVTLENKGDSITGHLVERVELTSKKDGKKFHLGTFPSVLDAAIAYDEKAIEKAFCWGETDEGYNFWFNIRKDWFENLGINDKYKCSICEGEFYKSDLHQDKNIYYCLNCYRKLNKVL